MRNSNLASWLSTALAFALTILAVTTASAMMKASTTRAAPIAPPAFSFLANHPTHNSTGGAAASSSISRTKVDATNRVLWSEADLSAGNITLCFDGLYSNVHLKTNSCEPSGIRKCFTNPLDFVDGQNLEYQGLDKLEDGTIADKWLKVPTPRFFNQQLVWVAPNTSGTNAVFLQVCTYGWTQRILTYTVEKAGFIAAPAVCVDVPGIMDPLTCPLAPVTTKVVNRIHPSSNYSPILFYGTLLLRF